MAIPTKVIKIVAQGPQGSPGRTGDVGPQGAQGPSGSADGAWTRKANDNLYYNEGNVGLGNFELVDPSAELEIRRDEASNDLNDLFLIKQYDPNIQDLATRFVVNAEGVTVLGAFTTPPTAVEGGLYYNVNGNFYLGFDSE